MNHSATISNRFLQQKTSLKSKIAMWLIGLGSLTYLLLNIYHDFDLGNDNNGGNIKHKNGGENIMYINTTSNKFNEMVGFFSNK